MAPRIATVGGYALRPGVSRNGRLYTREAIAKAVARAQDRIAAGTMNVVRPSDVLSQRTHHAAEDDSTRIVGRVTAMSLAEDGSARFAADIADTPHGRTIADLAAPRTAGDPNSVDPFLTGVSIRGAWLGEVRRIQHDGVMTETSDDLEIDGIDYTGHPGVPGAEIDTYTPAASTRTSHESTAGRVLIFEAAQEVAVTTPVEEKGAPALKSGKPAAAPTKASAYADPGYQDDKAPRYALDTKAQAKSAWSYIHMPKNAKLYSPAQLKRIKGRIAKALTKSGVKVDPAEHWLIDPVMQVTESGIDEYYPDASTAGSFSISLSNGPVNITISSYQVDPADLDLVGRAAMAGACKALATIDPDMDGDMDVPGADAEDTDNDMETGPVVVHTETRGRQYELDPPNDGGVTEESPPPDAPTDPGSTTPNGASAVSDPPAPVPAADPTPEEEPAMADDTTPAVEPQAPATPATEPAAVPPVAAPTAVTLSDAQFQQLLAAATRVPELATVGAPAETAPAATTQETAPPTVQVSAAPPATSNPAVTETQEQMIARLVAEGVKEQLPLAVQNHVQATGLPGRRGLVARVGETSAAPAATTDGLNAYGVPADWPDKPLDKYTSEERKRFFGPAVRAHYLGDRDS